MLTDLAEKLKEVSGLNVFYGAVPDTMDGDGWNYIVMNRQKKRKNGKSALDYTDIYEVHVVNENYIPEDVEDNITSAICSLPGVRVEGDMEFSYTRKKNTNIVVEILTIVFARARVR